MTCHSPNSRIGVQILVLLFATALPGCSKLGKSPTEPSPPHAAGSKISYTAIGASDATVHGGAGASDQAGYIDSQVKNFGTDYTTLLTGIRALASNARIIALNTPNLAGLPLLASASLAQKQAAQRASVGMTTTVVNPLTAQNVIVVDLMCDSRTYQASNLSSDGFHPNDAGYAFIAAEVVRAITSSSYPAPR